MAHDPRAAASALCLRLLRSPPETFREEFEPDNFSRHEATWPKSMSCYIDKPAALLSLLTAVAWRLDEDFAAQGLLHELIGMTHLVGGAAEGEDAGEHDV